ncbi:Type I phosphodiesterase / nucleotide pyrophosphatase [Granulicella pectinivorans]|uniref:Type I phosphodiesterase / nucleotide pyrophosphatase n=1 Tax=Granulicella pectinivorans TaxID=474950 RepID=A0A1I6LAX6_9BACT|nr:alkaline phosphatase family protein [Granulicella pectinivorans]SFS00632.1 Type I phosphodiesterase / nucleotide pyrophosphatase [Granulicella pectinivorans]
MRKLLLSALALALLAPAAHSQAYEAKPKLVVLLVIDQFRGDYLERYRTDLKATNGFNLFLKKGAYFTSCYYDYASTKTAPGHATIGTGTYTDGHGIGSNEWWDLKRNTDRVVSSVEDERYRMVGTFDDLPVPPPPAISPRDNRIGASPLNLRVTTFGDEVRLATAGESKLYGVSLKDRAAILPAGQTANGAFWIDTATGRFVTSSFYMPELPAWATAFNKGPRIAQAAKEAGVDDTAQFYALVGRTSAANRYELDFARALIEGEKLGQHPVTDVLTVSLSANDILGHQMGPDSDTQKAMVVDLDKDLDAFFTYLDKKIGLGNVMVAFTADHGIAPVPAEAARLGIAAGIINLDTLAEKLNESLNTKFSPGKETAYLMPTQELPNIALDPRPFAKLKVSEKDAEAAVVEALPGIIESMGAPKSAPNNAATPEGTRKYADARLAPDPAAVFIRSHVDLAAGKVPNTEFGRRIAHSYTDHGDWYVMLIPAGYQMEYLNGIQTTHYSPWSYDRHVPLGFFGVNFVSGIYRDQVAPVDIAPTVTSLLGVNAPSASIGHVLVEAIRK